MTDSTTDSTSKLIAILQLAYSGELAAGYAYRGHWKSLSDQQERDAVKKIENDEWRHRELVGEMLRELGAEPDRHRELRALFTGQILGFLCHLSGWFAPMYGAGRLESRNIREYEEAARFAWESGNEKFMDCLLTMAEVEWDHEHYFREKVLQHRLSRCVRLWDQPPPKEFIRARPIVRQSSLGHLVEKNLQT